MLQWIREKLFKEKPYEPDQLEVIMKKLHIYCQVHNETPILENIYNALSIHKGSTIYHTSNNALEKAIDTKMLDILENKQIL